MKGGQEKLSLDKGGEENKVNDGFMQVKSRKQGRNSGGQKTKKEVVNRAPACSNPFQILEKEGDEGSSQRKEKEETNLITIESIKINLIETMEEDEVEDMDLGKLDLDAIEKECEKAGKGM